MARIPMKATRKAPVAQAVLGCLVAALVLAAAAPALAAGEYPFVTIGTASPAGAYYPLGVAMADIWNRNISGTQFSARETGGGVANMNMIAGNQIEVGIANENIAFDAMMGNEPFGRKIEAMGGWIMNQSMAVFVALKESGLRSVGDLAGKRVSLGAPGSSGNVIGELALKAYGIEKGDYSPVYLGWQEAADALTDGIIDAAIMVGGQPFPAIESLKVREPVAVLEIDEDKLQAVSSYPYSVGSIPAEMYDLEEDGCGVLVRSIIYLHPDLPDDLVYEMVRAIFANIPTLKAAHSSGDQAALFTPETAEAISLPIHPGVVRYASEVGVW